MEATTPMCAAPSSTHISPTAAQTRYRARRLAFGRRTPLGASGLDNETMAKHRRPCDRAHGPAHSKAMCVCCDSSGRGVIAGKHNIPEQRYYNIVHVMHGM